VTYLSCTCFELQSEKEPNEISNVIIALCRLPLTTITFRPALACGLHMTTAESVETEAKSRSSEGDTAFSALLPPPQHETEAI